MKSLVLNPRQLCDLELLLNGAFHPLNGFLREKDYKSVVKYMRLSNGALWPIPIVLSLEENKYRDYKAAKEIMIQDDNNNSLAILKNIEIYKPNLKKECFNVFGTTDDNHPYVKILLENPDVYYIGGELEKINLPPHYDFQDLRLTPEDIKKFFQQKGWTNAPIIAFQTRNPMHRSHFELTKFALSSIGEDAKLLIHPVVGVTQDCDIDYHTRVRCYKKILKYYPSNTVTLAIYPLSMRMAGPREALLHALIRQNYGCTHFIVGRDHAGPSYKDKNGNAFYLPFDAHELLKKYSHELKIQIIPSKQIVYVKETDSYYPANQVPENTTILNISGTEQRRLLMSGEEIPVWFSYPEIIEELRKSHKKKSYALYFVGLSGSGKSTMANAIAERLKETESKRKITILDGDIVRQHLSKGLGFSREDRSTNVQRIGYVASEIVKHGGVAICANIAPYQYDREINRKLIRGVGNYVEIYMRTPLRICEKRDVKGLYKMARKGMIKQFTGISDPFEAPKNSEITLEGDVDINENLEVIMGYLMEKNLIKE